MLGTVVDSLDVQILLCGILARISPWGDCACGEMMLKRPETEYSMSPANLQLYACDNKDLMMIMIHQKLIHFYNIMRN